MNKDPFYNSTIKNNTIKSTSPTTKVKKIKKIKTSSFLIGCLFFFFIFFILISLSIIFSIKNPNILTVFGLKAENIKTFLTTFTSIFFGSIVLIGFLIFLITIIKGSKAKVGKGKYFFSAGLSFIILIFSLGMWLISYIFIQKIKLNSQIKGNGIAFGLILDHNGKPLQIPETAYVAPSYFQFYLNKDLFQKQIITKYGNKIQNINLDCGNGQILKSNIFLFKKENPIFGKCFYTKKGIYNPKLIIGILNNDGTINNTEINLKPINIPSQINILFEGTSNNNFKLNNSKLNIIGGSAPLTIKIDAQDFLNNNPTLLQDGKINWDLNGDGKYEIKDKFIFTYNYENQGLYTIKMYFPKFDKGYTLANIIVNPKTIGDCQITYKKISKNNYIFKINLLGDNNIENIENIEFKIADQLQEKNIFSKSNTTKKVFTIKLLPGNYASTANIYFQNGKSITCKKDIYIAPKLDKIIINIYTTDIKDQELQNIKKLKTIILDEKNNNIDIEIKDLPKLVVFQIKKIIPGKLNDYKFNITDTLGNNLEKENKNTFKLKLTKNSQIKYKLIVYRNNNKYIFPINIKGITKKAQVILKANPTSGYEPLTVQFDATESQIQPDDEIIYFTWDFGDGKKLINSYKGKVIHKYNYDYENENGIYIAKVKIITKNGYTDTASVRISVKKSPKTIKIYSPSHPSQIARIGQPITFRIQANGNIKNIKWDFGDGNKYSCEYRACISIVHTYAEEGNFIVSAEVEFDDGNISSDNLTINVKSY